jgi:predicted O-methyltransferase YrrM
MNMQSKYFQCINLSGEKSIINIDDLFSLYLHELDQIGELKLINQAKNDFIKSVSGFDQRGNPYGFGGIKEKIAIMIYGLTRSFRPSVIVETGVCNGVSTTLFLSALHINARGRLYSIDYPELTDTTYSSNEFWQGKKGAAVPKGRQPGWIIPEKYKYRWELTLGKSQEKLPILLSNLKKIDFFLHDSEHSYECMLFEYNMAWNHLVQGGILASDDITWNDSFIEFAQEKNRSIYYLDNNIGLIIR